MKRFATAVGFASIVVGMAASIRADDDADPTGIWKWVADATAETMELSLKRDGLAVPLRFRISEAPEIGSGSNSKKRDDPHQ